MIHDKYRVDLIHKSDKSDRITVIDNSNDNLIMELVCPFGMNVPSDELKNSLARFFNEQPYFESEKKLRYHILKLPEEYMSIGICSEYLTVKTQELDYEKIYKDHEAAKPDEKAKEYAPAIHGENKLTLNEIVRICGIDRDTCVRRVEKFQTYIRYMEYYLRHQEHFDAIFAKVLAPTKKETRKLQIFKDLLLNPFQSSKEVCKKYISEENIVRKKNISTTDLKEYDRISASTVRGYVKRFTSRIKEKAREDKLLAPDLLKVFYSFVVEFRSIFSAKSTECYLKIPRIELKVGSKKIIRSEDNLYKFKRPKPTTSNDQ